MFARQCVNDRINAVIQRGAVDFVLDINGPVPAMVTMKLMGLPLEDWRDFAEPLHEVVYTPKESPDFPAVATRFAEMLDRCVAEWERYKLVPEQDNLLSYFAHQPFEGRMLTKDEVIGYSNNILAGGVDTTTALTTHVLVYLWQNPSEKLRLIEQPELLPKAREEFVRFFAPQHGVARNVTRDTSFSGVEMRAGDRIYMPWGAANRDPEIFDNPDVVDIERFPNRHIGFGAGMHRCIGSFFARVMFEELLTGILDRIPNYEIDIDAAERYGSIGTINGWKNLPATFTPGSRLG